jgi:hypothetical protein
MDSSARTRLPLTFLRVSYPTMLYPLESNSKKITWRREYDMKKQAYKNRRISTIYLTELGFLSRKELI